MLAYGYLPAQAKLKTKTAEQRQRHNQSQTLNQNRDGDSEADSGAPSLSSPEGRGGGVPDFWLKLLLSDYDDDSEYSSKREYALFHELFVWTPRFIDGVEVVVPGSGN